MNGSRGGDSMADAIALCVSIVSEVLPYSIAFGVTRMIVKIFLGAAFGGRLEI